jgi:hypothetical protein
LRFQRESAVTEVVGNKRTLPALHGKQRKVLESFTGKQCRQHHSISTCGNLVKDARWLCLGANGICPYHDRMDIFLSLNGHANTLSLPLRLGIRITERHQQFAELEGAQFDERGTRTQRQNEIDEGRKHYLGTLVIPHESPEGGEPYRLDCRLVLGETSGARQRRPVITVLRADNNKGDMTVTRHLEGMLKLGKINRDDVIRVFHPAYIRGDLQSSNDCEEVFSRQVQVPVSTISTDDQTARAILRDPASVVRAVLGAASEDVALKASLTFKPLPIPGVKYKYVLADAYISDVWMDGDVIKATFINSRGQEQTCHSFKPRDHLGEHHRRAFAYLSDRKDQRALFALCDSEPCRGFLAESVTSIALQIMRSAAGARQIESTAGQVHPLSA